MLAVWCGGAISAQDKYTVQVPAGVAFSEFRGFEDWPTVAVSQTGSTIEETRGETRSAEEVNHAVCRGRGLQARECSSIVV